MAHTGTGGLDQRGGTRTVPVPVATNSAARPSCGQARRPGLQGSTGQPEHTHAHLGHARQLGQPGAALPPDGDVPRRRKESSRCPGVRRGLEQQGPPDCDLEHHLAQESGSFGSNTQLSTYTHKHPSARGEGNSMERKNSCEHVPGPDTDAPTDIHRDRRPNRSRHTANT